MLAKLREFLFLKDKNNSNKYYKVRLKFLRELKLEERKNKVRNPFVKVNAK